MSATAIPVATLDPAWTVDFDNDPNYEDNHNFGWTMTFRAPDAEVAFRRAAAASLSVSMLPGDVTPDCIRPATADDIAEYEAMGGRLV